MKGFSAWPGKIDMPPEHLKRPVVKKVMHCVFFFGTYDFGWIPEHDLKPYQEFKEKMMTTKKSVKKAVDEIEEYISGGCSASSASIANAKKASMTPTAAKKTPAKKTPKKDHNSSATDDDDAEFDALFSPSEEKKAANPVN